MAVVCGIDPSDDLGPAPAPPEVATSEQARGLVWRVRLALGLLVVVTVGPFVQPLSAQPGARYALTAAVVEEGTVRIDDYRELTLPTDRVEIGDELYSDKAPGQPFFAVPFFALAKTVGLEDATTIRYTENLGVWWVSLWSVVLPVAIMVVLVFELARRFYPTTALAAAVGLWVGTLWLVFSTNLYGHALASALAFGAWFVLADREPTAGRALGAGLLVGASVATEYQMALVAVIIAGYLLWRRSVRGLLWYAVGGVPGLAVLLGYQAIAFGDALETPYAVKAASPALPGDDPSVGLPDPVQAFQIFFGVRGLMYTAIVILGLVGCVWIIRGRRPGREHAWMALAVFGAFFLLQSGWPNPWGGEMPGPRYLLPAIPWLAVPVAAIWSIRRTICLVVVGIGAFFMAPAVLTSHIIPHGWSFLRWYPKVLDEEGPVPTVFTMGLGPLGVVVHLALVAGAVYLLVVSARALRAAEAPSTEAMS